MSSDSARGYVHFFEECQTRIQSLGELLLIACKPHPVFSHQDDLAVTNNNFVRFRDEVISNLNKLLILSRDLSSQIHADTIHWKAIRLPLNDLTSTIVQLIQLSSHIAYLLALNMTGSEAAVLGPVLSKHRLVQADLELKFVCARLKRSRVSDLNHRLLVDLCGNITKSLSAMTEICREASEKITDSSEQDQFKLCIKAITSTAGCLVSSVKSFKHSSDDRHMQRLVCFCQPLISTSAALLAFATEEQFLGIPATLSPNGNDIYKSVIGLAMSMVSACVQITKALKDLVHDHTRTKHKDRISLCVESISRAVSRFRDLLLTYDFSAPDEWFARVKSDESSSLNKLSPADNERDSVATDLENGSFLSTTSISALSLSTGKNPSSSRSPGTKRSSKSSSKSKRRSSSRDSNVLSSSSPKTPSTPISPHSISEKDSQNSNPNLSLSSVSLSSLSLSPSVSSIGEGLHLREEGIRSRPASVDSPVSVESVLTLETPEGDSKENHSYL